MISLLDWRRARGQLEEAKDAAELRWRLLAIADAVGPHLVGAGVSPKAWRALDVIVVRRDLGGLSGYYERGAGQRVVLVAERDDPRRQRFTVAHEVGHMLLAEADRAALSLDRRREEELCDEFASRLLIPTSDLNRWLDSFAGEIDDLGRACSRYCVSLSVALSRLGAAYEREGMTIFAASRRGHPKRPHDVALRAHKSRCGDVLIPDDVSVASLGFGAIDLGSTAAAKAPIEACAKHVTLPLWRPRGSPRSGTATGRAEWQFRSFRNGIVLIRVRTAELAQHWWSERPERLVAA